MKQCIAILFLMASMLFLGGCLSPRTDGIAVEKGRLQLDNVPFSLNLNMIQDVMYRTEEGLLRVQVTVRNENRQDFDCQYRFLWKDNAGLTLTHAQTVWKPLVLHGQQQKVIEGVSPILGAEDFKLVLRPAGLQ